MDAILFGINRGSLQQIVQRTSVFSLQVQQRLPLLAVKGIAFIIVHANRYIVDVILGTCAARTA